MATYFDKIMYLYPNIQGVLYWHTQSTFHNITGKNDMAYDGVPWPNAYDGLIWSNTDILKPTQEELDALDNASVDAQLSIRKEKARKISRDTKAKSDLALMALYDASVKSGSGLTLTQYLDQLETIDGAAVVSNDDIL